MINETNEYLITCHGANDLKCRMLTPKNTTLLFYAKEGYTCKLTSNKEVVTSMKRYLEDYDKYISGNRIYNYAISFISKGDDDFENGVYKISGDINSPSISKVDNLGINYGETTSLNELLTRLRELPENKDKYIVVHCNFCRGRERDEDQEELFDQFCKNDVEFDTNPTLGRDNSLLIDDDNIIGKKRDVSYEEERDVKPRPNDDDFDFDFDPNDFNFSQNDLDLSPSMFDNIDFDDTTSGGKRRRKTSKKRTNKRRKTNKRRINKRRRTNKRRMNKKRTNKI